MQRYRIFECDFTTGWIKNEESGAGGMSDGSEGARPSIVDYPEM
jgi:hypothetical protein